MKFFFRTGIAAMALLLFMFRNAKRVHKKQFKLRLNAETPFRPFRMVFIADIHRRKLPRNFIDSQVDLIVIGGDLTERGVSLKRTAKNLRLLSEAAPAYFIWGNNDREVGERALRKVLNHCNVKILDNESVELFGQQHLKLVGIDYFGYTDGMVADAFADVQPGDTVIFASHTPAAFKLLGSEYPADLLMAGHTHGGQIRLGKFGFYTKGALKKINSRYELVTNGYGTTSVPLRFGAEAQYHVLDIAPRLPIDRQ